ncbi:hypothetical protein ACFQ0D_13860 [Micromonospora zhanjiangensis]
MVQLWLPVAILPGPVRRRADYPVGEPAAVLGEGHDRRVHPVGAGPGLATQPGALVNLPPRLGRHTPVRPLWICRACAGPWPCSLARLLLKAEYWDRRADLPVQMTTVLYEAVADLHRLDPAAVDPAAMFNRFVGWTRRNHLGRIPDLSAQLAALDAELLRRLPD